MLNYRLHEGHNVIILLNLLGKFDLHTIPFLCMSGCSVSGVGGIIWTGAQQFLDGGSDIEIVN